MSRVSVLIACAIYLAFSTTDGHASDFPEPELQPGVPTHELFAGPHSAGDATTWLSGLQKWREGERANLSSQGVDFDAVYRIPELAWTKSDFVQPQIMAHDLYVYDPLSARYTVERFLDDVEKRYGGVDSVLFWPTYPNIGIDERNQYDLTRDLPGGLPALRKMVDDFHSRGVKVLLPLNPWDNGTRAEGVPHALAIARLLKEIGADGFNGDTMTAPSEWFFYTSLVLDHPIAIEPEVGVGDQLNALSWTPLSWGYWEDYQGAPGVDRYKWLEPRHLTHVCNRWAKNRGDELQYAWFNGDGYESWENVWGIWNGITPRDASVIRRLSTISRALPTLLSSPNWQPFAPTLQAGVYSSRFNEGSQTLWTLVNRSDQVFNQQPLLTVPYHGETFYDLWSGTELVPQLKDGRATLLGSIEGYGYGAIFATDSAPSRLMAKMQALAQTPLSSLSNDWQVLPQQFVPIPLTAPAAQAPEGMRLIPGTDHYRFQVSGVEIEQDLIDGVDVQYPWEDEAVANHDHVLSIPSFYMDEEPVTNADFAEFLAATHYAPRDSHHFLANWKEGHYAEADGRRPVTWVSLEDARAYASWAGKRLPHEWEWQYAAQGVDARVYPWGNEPISGAVPEIQRSRGRPVPDIVGTHPKGSSPFGILDLVGNVWQWTEEVTDAHTRAAVVRGGSLYQPQGSMWYFPQAYRLDQHGKYLLMAPSIDRSGMIGFRCVKDAQSAYPYPQSQGRGYHGRR